VRKDTSRVPPYPAVAMKVREMVRREDFRPEELVRLVVSDPALTADVLRCANTVFGGGAQITSLALAISRMGAKQLASLPVLTDVVAEAPRPGPLASLRRRSWQRSFLCASLARDLARSRGLRAEEAFACGLLHDIGEVIALACIEDLVARGEDAVPLPAAEWQAIVDRYHVELGLAMAVHWGLPPLISDVISLHHSVDLAGAEDPALVEVVAACDEVVALAEDRPGVSPADLGVVSLLTARECDLLAASLETLPPLIAALEATPQEDGPTLVAPTDPGPAWRAPARPDFKVVVRVHQKETEYEPVGIAHNNVMVTGSQPVPENLLLQLKLSCRPTPLTCWGQAKFCWPEGNGFTTLLQPFALDPAGQMLWKDLVAQTMAA